MGTLYNRFIEAKMHTPIGWFTDRIGLVKFSTDKNNYEIYFTRKRANRLSIIHCKNHSVEWEQLPLFPRLAGRAYGISEPFISLAPSKACVRIVVIMGKPGGITGLDDGIFRSIHKYDESFINVMPESCFKKL